MSSLLKQVIQDLINGHSEQAQVNIQEYIIGMTKEIVASKTSAQKSFDEIIEGHVYSPQEARDMRYAVKKHYGAPPISKFNDAQRAAISMLLSDHHNAKIIGEYTVDYPKHTSIAVISTGSALFVVAPNGKKHQITSTWKPEFEDFGMTKVQADAVFNKGRKSWKDDIQPH